MKLKTLKISEELHSKIKEYCNKYNYKMNKWCELQLDERVLSGIEYSKLNDKSK